MELNELIFLGACSLLSNTKTTLQTEQVTMDSTIEKAKRLWLRVVEKSRED
jgi:hypothetical protein